MGGRAHPERHPSYHERPGHCRGDADMPLRNVDLLSRHHRRFTDQVTAHIEEAAIHQIERPHPNLWKY